MLFGSIKKIKAMTNKDNQLNEDMAVIKDWRKVTDKRFDKLEDLISNSHKELQQEFKDGLGHMAGNIKSAYGKYVKLEEFIDFKESISKFQKEVTPKIEANSTFRQRVLGGIGVVSFIGMVNLILLIAMWSEKF